MQTFNNFQRKETAKWLLNMSQAASIAGAGGLFIPGIEGQVSLINSIALTILALTLYLLAMYIGKEVKNDK